MCVDRLGVCIVLSLSQDALLGVGSSHAGVGFIVVAGATEAVLHGVRLRGCPPPSD